MIAQSLLNRSLYQGLELVPQILATMMLKSAIQIPDIDIDPYIRPYARAVVDATQKIHDAVNAPVWYDEHWRFWLKNIFIDPYAPWIYELILGESQEGSLEYALATETADQNDLVRAVEKFFEEWDVAYGNLQSNIKTQLESDSFSKYLYSQILRLRREYAKWIYNPSISEEPTPEQLAQKRDLLEVTRLINHIGDNFLHYCYTIWAAENPNDRITELSNIILPGDKPLLEVIENKVLGYYADYAIFPFIYPIPDEDEPLKFLIEAYEELPQDQLAAEPFDAVLPTNGIVVEPQLGEENACEPFIQEHRKYDLEQKALEVQRYNIENQRRQKKVKNCQLENPECCPSPKYGFFRRFLYWLRGKEED